MEGGNPFFQLTKPHKGVYNGTNIQSNGQN